TQANTWVAFKVFTEIASRVKGDITSANLVAAIKSGGPIETGNLTAPLDFNTPFSVPNYARLFNQSAYLWTVKDGAFAPLSGRNSAGDAVPKGVAAAGR